MHPLIEQLKALTGEILDAHVAGKLDLPENKHCDLKFEEVLAIIHDDFIPEMAAD